MCHHAFKKGRYTMQTETKGRLFESYYAKMSVDLLSSLTPSSVKQRRNFHLPRR